MKVLIFIFLTFLSHAVVAFVVSPTRTTATKPIVASFQNRFHGNDARIQSPAVLHPAQRHSLVSTRLMGLFGLGTGEILLILIGIGVVLGPQKLLDMVRSSPQALSEYKDELSKIPEEFQKGMEEGEIEARSRKAKPIKKVDVTTNKDAN
jgi:Sec-independent protein translocase protein TatA